MHLVGYRVSLPVLLAVASLAGIDSIAQAQTPPNPYCVSGADWSANGTMARLNMPADSLGYIWDNLYATNLPNMVRPCRYWQLVWGGHQAHGYHETDDTIDNPAVFGQWVDAHPGRIWIIGNEPNIYPQDGISPAQYARMFKKYYDFILARDPSARFAVAGLAGDANPAALQGNKDWWNQALGEYRSQFGAEMPIDIWNCHGYRQIGDLDPDRTMAEYFTPYRQFVDTVSGGIYAGKELWCTEFGVPGWSTTLDPSLLAEFVTQLCPRLEAGGYSRFFWFLGPWPGGWDASMNDLALVGADGLPTVLGQTYSGLAHSYPNPIPPPSPSQLPLPSPPLLITNDFSTTAAPLRVVGGDWTLDGGTYRQTRTINWGLHSQLWYDYQDVRVAVDLRINSAPSSSNWAGVSVRTGDIWNSRDISTYLVLLRQSGELNIYTAPDGTVASVPGAVSDTSIWHQLQVDIRGWQIQVSLDGVPRITWTDPHHRRASGAVSLYAGRANCSFDHLSVLKIVPPTAVIKIQPAEGFVPLTVSLDGTGSSDPNTALVSYAWDFDDDGIVDDTSGPLTSHLYYLPGTYTARLTVTNEYGITGSSTARIIARGYLGDFDHDGDVDQGDFGHLQACLTGAGVPQTDPDCSDARLDSNEDVSASDVALFLQCLSGAQTPADPACAR